MVGINVRFIGKKISRVRFKPDVQNLAGRGDCVLVTGSWDDQINSLCLWLCSTKATLDELESTGVRCLQKVDQRSDVSDLCFAGAETLVVALASGDVHLHSCSNAKLEEQQRWSQLHRGSPCTAVAARGPNKLASVGEDGRLCHLTPGCPSALRIIEGVDSGAPTCLRFVRHDQVVVGNLAGHLHLWDLGSPDCRPAQDLFWCGEQVTSLGQHPSQGHLLATGAASGRLCLWDLRKSRVPTTTLAAPTKGALSEMVFEPGGALLTCAHDGSLLRWAAPGLPRAGVELEALVRPQGRALNSVDLYGSLVAAGSDAEALLLIPLE